MKEQLVRVTNQTGDSEECILIDAWTYLDAVEIAVELGHYIVDGSEYDVVYEWHTYKNGVRQDFSRPRP